MRIRSYLLVAGMGLVVVLGAARAHAGAFDVTIDSTPLQGTAAVLVFDFFDGGPPDNTVDLSALSSDGTQGATTIIPAGSITGTGPWHFPDAGSPELQVSFTKLGTFVSFSFVTSDNPADPLSGSSPDAFSFSILNPDLSPLIATDEPLGSNALFLYNIGEGPDGLAIFNPQLTPEQAGFSFVVTPAQSVPEPTSFALLAAGLVALSTRRRRML